MKIGLLDKICCPRSGEPLILESTSAKDGEDIISGTLKSVTSGNTYSIEQGIPNLIIEFSEKVEQTAQQFSFEHTKIGEHANPRQKAEEDVLLYFLKTGLDPQVYKIEGLDISQCQSYKELGYSPKWEKLNDKIVVDAGSASGRYAKLVAPHCKQLILMDLGDHIYEAKKELSHFDHVHYIKCNLLHPPLKPNTIDFIYSIGVLHHTPDPPKSFSNLAQSLKDGGAFSLWVYPPAYWSHSIKAFVAKFIRKILLSMSFPKQVFIIQHLLYPLGRLQMRIASRFWLKIVFSPLFLINVPRHEDKSEMLATIMDYYTPQYIFTYTDHDLHLWYENAGLTYNKLDFPTAGIGFKSGLKIG
ncbi:MAG: class I SAM-dependent methyltransferase [Flavobacteriales bacterium]|nr:class I SAM-dependent methyltransferase [Flavobacteriales bacterium]